MLAGGASPAGPPPARRTLVLLVFLLTLTASGVSLLTKRQLADLGGNTDEWFMLGVNLNLHHTLGLGGHASVFRAPGYPFFTAAALGASDWLRSRLSVADQVPGPEPVYFAQCLLLAASACLLCAWLLERIGSALALLAALMFGLNPYSVILTGLLHYDILHIFLLIAGSWALHRALVEARPARLLLAGVVAGLATLVRPVTLALPPFVLAAFLLGGSSRRWWSVRSASCVVLAMLLAIAPWTARNYRLTGRFIPVSAQAWAGLWGSTVIEHEMQPDVYLWSRVAGPFFMPIYQRVTGLADYRYGAYVRHNLELEDELKRETLDNLRRQPGIYLHNVARSLLTLSLQINTVFLTIFELRQQAGAGVSAPPGGPAAPPESRTSAGFSWFVTTLTALAGLGLAAGLARRDPMALAAAAFGLCVALAHAVTYMDLMYYYVKVPFLFLFAGLGLGSLRRFPSGLRLARRSVSLAHVIAAVLLVWSLGLTVSLLA